MDKLNVVGLDDLEEAGAMTQSYSHMMELGWLRSKPQATCGCVG